MIAVGTSTVELVNGFIDQIGPASATVLTGIALTANQFHRAVLASIFWLARAKVICPAISAHPVFAGIISLAFVDLVLAMIALITFIAFTGVAADAVHACTCLARVTVAFVNVHFAILAGNSLYTETLVSEISGTYSFDIEKYIRYFIESFKIILS